MDQATPSTASDGPRPPFEIVELTLERGHSTIAILKRDTPSSMGEVRKGAGRGALEVIPDGDVVAAKAVGRVQGRCASPENTAMRRWL